MSSLPRSQRVEAVVLRHSDWGEADRMLTIFTRELGKLRVVAKGARRPRSRKAGHLEPFTRVALLLARGREIWIVTQAETLDAYLPVRDDLERTGYAAYVAELLDRFTYEEGENSSLYRLFVEALERVSTLEDPVPAIRYYEIRLLDLLGFRPELFHCVQCGNEIQPEAQYFSALLGGVVCPRCGIDAAGVRPVSVQALKYLRHYQRSSYAEATRVRLPDAVRPELEALMQHYLTYLLERGLNSPAFLREVRRKYTGD
ncbi:MAG: DNA repair protein RecO [Chloroflexi bacterium]|nr:DNA repair protein RecO [Chloroflexota bacterium]